MRRVRGGSWTLRRGSEGRYVEREEIERDRKRFLKDVIMHC